MRLSIVLSVACVAVGLTSVPARANPSMYGDQISGSVGSWWPVLAMQSFSGNQGPSSAVVGDGVEFAAGFTTLVDFQWRIDVDFRDDCTVFFTMTETTGQSWANIASGEMIRFQFTDFDFPITDLQLLDYPAWDQRSIYSFDANNVWIGFDCLAAWHTYTFRVVPEPGTMALLVGGAWVLTRCRKRGTSLIIRRG